MTGATAPGILPKINRIAQKNVPDAGNCSVRDVFVRRGQKVTKPEKTHKIIRKMD